MLPRQLRRLDSFELLILDDIGYVKQSADLLGNLAAAEAGIPPLHLDDRDSAATAPRPPGLPSFARVTSRWAIKMNSSRMKANFNGK